MIKYFKNKNLYWQTDNIATTSIIGSGSNKVQLQNLALEIYDLTRNNNISLNIQWFPPEFNKTANLLSKSIDYDDWFVTENYFKFINTKWGAVTIAMCATKQNKKKIKKIKKYRNGKIQFTILESKNRSRGRLFTKLV